MLRHLRFALFAAFLAAAPHLFAQVEGAPTTIDYQGRVLDANNVPLGNTTPTNYEIKFRIWDAQEGGNLIWAERQVVTVDKGNFSVRLGEGSEVTPNGGVGEPRPPLATVFSTRERFLGLTVVIPGQPEGEIGPRLAFLSTPYAFTAEKAASVDAPPGTTSNFASASFSGATTFNQTAALNSGATVNGDLAVNQGSFRVNSDSRIVFGLGLSGRSPGSGVFDATANSMNIGGISNTGNDSGRRITMWAEAGTEFMGPIDFGFRGGQHINFFGGSYGIGSATATMLYRVPFGQTHRWYDGGSYNSDPEANGRTLALLNGNGFELRTGRFIGDGSGLINLTISRGNNHGIFASSFDGGHSFGSQDFTTFSRSNGDFAWYHQGVYNSGFMNAGGGTTLMQLNTSGLQVNTALNVSGTSRRNISYTFYARNGNAPATGFVAATDVVQIGIYTPDRVVASEFNATSDARLKVVQGRTDNRQDLETVRAIKITNYAMKDESNGRRKFKKIIAQELEEVFPQAVTRARGIVPDIFRMATARQGIVSLPEVATLGLKPGEKVQLVQPERTILTEITEVKAESFTVKDPIDGELFVYGREVEDLRTVDYEGVSMLNVSATQELARRIDFQTAELLEVRKQRDALAKEVAALQVAKEEQDARLAQLEARLDAVARRAGSPFVPASVQVKLDRR